MPGAAAGGYRLGEKHYYGDGTAQDYGAAVESYRKAADQGHAAAQFSLGFMYFHGQGVPQDYGEAAEWYRKAADQGHAGAQSNLGWLYLLGNRLGGNLPEDKAESAAWFRRAVDQGDSWAAYYLGDMYSRGEGVPQDDVQAYAWWNIAAARVSWQAEMALDRHGGQMTREQIDEALRLSADLAPE